MKPNGGIPIDGTAELIAGLQADAAYPHACDRIQVIETHISYVILTGEFAYKIKKPVHFPFVDFSTLTARRQSCDDELRLNRRLARDLYLDVVPIGGTPQSPRIGAEPAIEYAVRMVQFSPAQTLDHLLQDDVIDTAAIHELAEQIASFHAGLDPVHGQVPGKTALATFEALCNEIADRAEPRLPDVGKWLAAQARALAAEFLERDRGGFVRECHGDLHLGNLVRIGSRIQAFDCIEFSKSLRSIDVLDEVAFLVMDLLAHRRDDLAFEFLNRYLERAGDYAGVRVLRFYLVHRALVRSYVRALAAGNRAASEPDVYLDLAANLIAPRAPLLLITTGLSGSGKTTVTDQLIGRLPAIRIRSDLLRKRLHGFDATERSGSGLGSGLYSSDISEQTYAALAGFAETALRAGFDVIVDAAFLERARRAVFAEMARRCGVAFGVLAVSADQALLEQRVAARWERGSDASEADARVLEYQLARAEPVAPDEPGVVIPVDTGRPVDAARLLAQIRAALA